MTTINTIEEWNTIFRNEVVADGDYFLGSNIDFMEQPNVPRFIGYFNGGGFTLSFSSNHEGFMKLEGGMVENVNVVNNGGILLEGALFKTSGLSLIEKPCIVCNCKFVGNLEQDFTGGLFGDIGNEYESLRILKCSLVGDILADNCGAIASKIQTNINIVDFTLVGHILGNNNGGLIGANSKGDILLERCKHLGNVIGDNCGGFVGEKFRGDIQITNCSTEGEIWGKNSSGILGKQANGTIYILKCSSIILLKGENTTGMVGCYANGKIIAEEAIISGNIDSNDSSGLIGNNLKGEITIINCKYKGIINATNSQGFIGSHCSESGKIQVIDCKSEADILGNNSSGMLGNECAIRKGVF